MQQRSDLSINSASSAQKQPPALAAQSRRILTPQIAAAVLGCDDKTITRWARMGYLPAHPIGQGKKKYWRFFEVFVLKSLSKPVASPAAPRRVRSEMAIALSRR